MTIVIIFFYSYKMGFFFFSSSRIGLSQITLISLTKEVYLTLFRIIRNINEKAKCLFNNMRQSIIFFTKRLPTLLLPMVALPYMSFIAFKRLHVSICLEAPTDIGSYE
ncbi:MAG: hypothetical protein EXX96DRAFT_198152 [Benjaminiella poitrasii]|nr:MAG: hypothetical protein EXX96DRAFT_198152 [Benjaminiella poitrasii]